MKISRVLRTSVKFTSTLFTIFLYLFLSRFLYCTFLDFCCCCYESHFVLDRCSLDDACSPLYNVDLDRYSSRRYVIIALIIDHTNSKTAARHCEYVFFWAACALRNRVDPRTYVSRKQIIQLIWTFNRPFKLLWYTFQPPGTSSTIKFWQSLSIFLCQSSGISSLLKFSCFTHIATFFCTFSLKYFSTLDKNRLFESNIRIFSSWLFLFFPSHIFFLGSHRESNFLTSWKWLGSWILNQNSRSNFTFEPVRGFLACYSCAPIIWFNFFFVQWEF